MSYNFLCSESNTKITIPVSFLMFAWYTFFHLFSSNLSMLLNLKWVFYKPHIVESCFFYGFTTLSFVIFGPCIFKVVFLFQYLLHPSVDGSWFSLCCDSPGSWCDRWHLDCILDILLLCYETLGPIYNFTSAGGHPVPLEHELWFQWQI